MNNSAYFKRLGEIIVDDFSGYLESKGWVRDGLIDTKAIVWHRIEEVNFEFEVIQPIGVSVRGIVQKIKEAVESVAEFEARSPESVLDDIQSFRADLVKVRVIHHDVDGGSIPLDDGVLLIEKSKELLVASTLSTFKKSKYFSGGRSADVQDFISRLRLGQTEVGSFVINLISPISINAGVQGEIDKTSLTRSVTTNLARSLTAISSAIDSYSLDGDVFHFDEVVSVGVSANLCDALIGLSGASKTRSFEVSIKLAGVEVDNQGVRVKHYFKPEQLPIIERASEYFKGNYVIDGYTAFGLVTKMKHISGEDFGEITISSMVNYSEKNITVQLGLGDYWEAVHAHEAESYVSCSGSLIVTPRAATLAEPGRLSVTRSDDLL